MYDSQYFEKLFSSMPLPVIVVKNDPELTIAYLNSNAKLLLNPLSVVKHLLTQDDSGNIQQLLAVQNRATMDTLMSALAMKGSLNDFAVKIIDFEGNSFPFTVVANTIDLDDMSHAVLYLRRDGVSGVGRNAAFSSTLFQIAAQTADSDQAINAVLAYVGDAVQVSRTYIFEEISEEDTANTYEWCAAGIEPAIQDLQNLKKSDYNYDVIVNGGMYITDDVDDLPAQDRDILAAQGIRALAILPLIHGDKPLGYVGFDDCAHKRVWTHLEVQALKNTADFLLSLLLRRNAERNLMRSHTILQTITDSIENLIYVNDIHTNELVFANKPLLQTLGLSSGDILGKPCWEVLQRGMSNMCDFCPIPTMIEKGYDKTGKTYTWEFENTHTGQWYLLKDTIVKWTDNRLVHMETATEITHQKNFEEQLLKYASTDMMTGAYNREWGQRILRDTRRLAMQEGSPACVLFLDVDGLKVVNDAYGHDVGDELILHTVDIVRSCIRKSDVICRWGGDEFLLVLKCSEEIAGRIVNNIYRKIDEYNEHSGKPYRLGFSYGITSLTDPEDESIELIVARADKHMYENKINRRAMFSGEV